MAGDLADVEVGDAVVDGLPGSAAVLRAVDPAVEGPGKDVAVEVHGDRLHDGVGERLGRRPRVTVVVGPEDAAAKRPRVHRAVRRGGEGRDVDVRDAVARRLPAVAVVGGAEHPGRRGAHQDVPAAQDQQVFHQVVDLADAHGLPGQAIVEGAKNPVAEGGRQQHAVAGAGEVVDFGVDRQERRRPPVVPVVEGAEGAAEPAPRRTRLGTGQERVDARRPGDLSSCQPEMTAVAGWISRASRPTTRRGGEPQRMSLLTTTTLEIMRASSFVRVSAINRNRRKDTEFDYWSSVT